MRTRALSRVQICRSRRIGSTGPGERGRGLVYRCPISLSFFVILSNSCKLRGLFGTRCRARRSPSIFLKVENPYNEPRMQRMCVSRLTRIINLFPLSRNLEIQRRRIKLDSKKNVKKVIFTESFVECEFYDHKIYFLSLSFSLFPDGSCSTNSFPTFDTFPRACHQIAQL